MNNIQTDNSNSAAKRHYKGYSYREQTPGTYTITVSHKGKRHYKSWYKPTDMSESKALREVEKIAMNFSNEIKNGQQYNNKKTFSAYAEYVINLKAAQGLKPTTLNGYRDYMKRLDLLMGDVALTDITPQFLNNIYIKLASEGTRTISKAIAKPILTKIIKERKITQEFLHKKGNIAKNTIMLACKGKHIAYDSAIKIATALECNVNDLFEIIYDPSPLSSKTISLYVKFIGTVMKQAETEFLVSYNAYERSSPPRLNRKEANFLSPEVIAKILESSSLEPIKWKVMINLYIMTGARRGEILALKFNKIFWDENRIRIDSSIVYTSATGTYNSTPKTKSSVRDSYIPAETMQLLKDYYNWYIDILAIDESTWDKNDYLFFQEKDLPEIKPMNPTSVTSYMTKFSKKYDLPHINPHAYRHSYASLLIHSKEVDDIELPQLLGHSSSQITKEVYGHLMTNRHDIAANILEKTYKK